MSTKSFRRKLFGGFEPDDVMSYIKRLAEQRNEYKVAYERMAEQVDELRNEFERVFGEIEELDHQEIEMKVAMLENNRKSLAGFEQEYASLRLSMEAATEHIQKEFGWVNETLTLMSSILSNAVEHYSEFRDMIRNDKKGLTVPEVTEDLEIADISEITE